MSGLDAILKSRLCNGCGACVAMAPNNIEMRETEDEARRPKLNRPLSKEQEAEIVAHCPAANTALPQVDKKEITSAAWGPILEVWEGYAADEEICFKGSSGGAVTALALFGIEKGNHEGALHVKADKDDPRFNKASVSRNRSELLEGSGSRYAPASVCDGLPELKNINGSAIVVGKPCDIAGALQVSKLDVEIAKKIGATISIFCAGTPSHKGTKSLLKHLGDTPSRKLKKLQYRGNGWPGNMRADWETAQQDTISYETSYGNGWGNILQKHRQWSCHTCADHTGEFADISVGDPWQNPPEKELHGKSLIIVRTERGKALLRKAMQEGYLIAEPKPKDTLFAAQPNLFATKGAVWGRSVAFKLLGLKSPALLPASLECWKALPFKQKLQSILGTFKRIGMKRLYAAKTTNFHKQSQVQ